MKKKQKIFDATTAYVLHRIINEAMADGWKVPENTIWTGEREPDSITIFWAVLEMEVNE